MRSKLRFRQLFLILGVIALANGVVGAVQARLSPTQLAAWGPGYRELASGGEGNGITARTYSVEGVAHVRPPALGSDAGFGGSIGARALPGLLALLAIGGRRRRWPIILLCMGAVLGIATAGSRTAVVAGVVAVGSYAALSLFAGLRLSRPLVGVLVVGAIVFVVGSLLISTDGAGIFHRQETLASLQTAQETGGSGKERSLSQIPRYLAIAPFGFGLGTTASVSGFGGHQRLEIEGEKVEGGNAYSILVKEMGIPGLVLWLGLSINVLVLGMRRLRRVVDIELRTYFVALLAGFITLTIQGFSGPTLAVTNGAFLWFVPGVVAYWFAGPGRSMLRRAPVAPTVSAVPAGAT
jgi:O-antigen ligase